MQDNNAPVRCLVHNKLYYEVCCHNGTVRVAATLGEVVVDVSSRTLVIMSALGIRLTAYLESTCSDMVVVMQTVTAPLLLGSTGVVKARLIVH